MRRHEGGGRRKKSSSSNIKMISRKYSHEFTRKVSFLYRKSVSDLNSMHISRSFSSEMIHTSPSSENKNKNLWQKQSTIVLELLLDTDARNRMIYSLHVFQISQFRSLQPHRKRKGNLMQDFMTFPQKKQVQFSQIGLENPYQKTSPYHTSLSNRNTPAAATSIILRYVDILITNRMY